MFILGNQKAGTSAIAGLLGELTGMEVTIDLRREIRELLIPRILSGESSIEQLIRHNRRAFAAPIIKEPSLTLVYDQLRTRFPKSTYVFVVRDPRDNIRSILDRLEIDGRATKIEDPQWERITPAWRVIIGGGDRPPHLDALADRWMTMAHCYWANEASMILIRYEDFMSNKAESIRDLADRIGLAPVRDISDLVDYPFQPRGKHRGIGHHEFFGTDNLARIEGRCRALMTRFGYLPAS